MPADVTLRFHDSEAGRNCAGDGDQTQRCSGEIFIARSFVNGLNSGACEKPASSPAGCSWWSTEIVMLLQQRTSAEVSSSEIGEERCTKLRRMNRSGLRAFSLPLSPVPGASKRFREPLEGTYTVT